MGGPARGVFGWFRFLRKDALEDETGWHGWKQAAQEWKNEETEKKKTSFEYGNYLLDYIAWRCSCGKRGISDFIVEDNVMLRKNCPFNADGLAFTIASIKAKGIGFCQRR